MTRIRSSMVLLAICVCAVLVSALRLATERAPLPAGSSYSSQADGAMALYEWSASVGAQPRQLRDGNIDPSVMTLLVLQPEVPLDSATRAAFDEIPSRGGTLVIAGDSIPWLLYVRALGLTAEPVSLPVSTATTPDRLSIPFSGRYRLSVPGAQPLLVLQDGTNVGLRVPYKRGSLLVVSSADPFTNAGLRAPDVARYVYRDVLSSLSGGSVGFDEIHHSFAPASASPTNVNTLLFDTGPGRAIMYCALLIFVFVSLNGRRLGPALSATDPSATQRTMFEHVQMLADLYRRAGQFHVVHDYFLARYGQRQHVAPRERDSALRRVASARTESELIAAVAQVDDAN